MRHMSLCTGYGGIDMALAEVLGAETVAVADIDKGACKILAHRFPDVPNLGDITTTDWASWVGNVDVISGGTPCQDLSHAGRRAGMTEGTRSNLWVAMREAISVIRPSLVVWENVRGAYSACADSELGRCPRCVDPDSGVGHAPYLRALGRVLGDLSSLGYDACWYGLRASDVGAAHHRYRVFAFAWDATNPDALRSRFARRPSDTLGRPELGAAAAGGREVPSRLMPTPVVTDAKAEGPSDAARHTPQLRASSVLFPTPAVANRDNRSMSAGAALRPGLETLAAMLPSPRTSDTNGAGAHGDGGPDLRTAVTFLPRTTAMDYKASGGGYSQNNVTLTDATARARQDWCEYEPAIRRQEAAFGRPAPLPTEPGRTGKPRLSPRFSEWLMGCPDGWITDVPSITRNEALKAAGNGVVPQQCAAAARRFLADLAALEVAA